MVEHFLRLKLRLLGNSFRRNPWQLVGMSIALLYGIGTAVLLVAGLFALRFVDIEIARSAEVVFGSLVVVVFTVLPLLLGIDDTLDPRRFSLFGMSNNRLAFGIALSSLISVPAVVITLIALSLIVTWSRTPLATGLAVVSAVLIVVTCLLSARVTTSIASFALSTRRARDITSVVGLVVLVLLAPVVVLLANVDWANDAVSVLGRIERVLAWTPFGASWGAPADAAAGDTTEAIWKIVIAVAWVGVLWVVWRALLAKMLVSPERQPAARRYVGLGWFDRLPSTPIGVIAARNLTYWGRDARYGASLAIIPLIPAIMIIALLVGGVPIQPLLLLPVPIICLFLSWTVHNDVSFDNTAIWLHLAASTSGRADRWGRLVPVLLVGVPIIAIGSVLSAWGYGDWTVLPALIGVSASILLSGLGLSSIMSAAFPYPSVRPGDSPFSQPPGGSGTGGIVQGFSFIAIIVFSAPAAFFATLGLLGNPMWHVWSLIAGAGIGLVVLIVGVTIGARVYDSRGPNLLAFAMRN